MENILAVPQLYILLAISVALMGISSGIEKELPFNKMVGLKWSSFFALLTWVHIFFNTLVSIPVPLLSPSKASISEYLTVINGIFHLSCLYAFPVCIICTIRSFRKKYEQ